MDRTEINNSVPKQRYSQDLSDIRWKLKSDNIKIRDNYTCRICCKKGKQLDVHHIRYIDGLKPWDYDDGDLVTLCHPCHEKLHERQLKKETFYPGDYFYSENLQGVGIISSVDEEGVNFEICWTENLSCIHEDHPRLYLMGSEFWDFIREPSDEEIDEFWMKCCNEHPIIIEGYLSRYFSDYLPPNHPIIAILDDFYKREKSNENIQ